jgi:hypothetical protein
VNVELLNALMLCSVNLQDAHTIARKDGREDICQDLRRAAWKVAKAISEIVPDQSEEIAS